MTVRKRRQCVSRAESHVAALRASDEHALDDARAITTPLDRPELGGTNGENAAHASICLGNQHVDVSLGRVAVRKPGAHEATIPNISKFRATKARIEDAEKPRARTCRRSHETKRLREFVPLAESMVMSGRIGIVLRSMVAAFFDVCQHGLGSARRKAGGAGHRQFGLPRVPALPNPTADAKLMSATLLSLGAALGNPEAKQNLREMRR
jgi:hypothetical protein